MRFHLVPEGQKEPGIAILGTREDIESFARRLAQSIKQTDTGKFVQVHPVVTGCSIEWFAFRPVDQEELDTLLAQERRTIWWRPLIGLIAGIGILVILFFALRGFVIVYPR